MKLDAETIHWRLTLAPGYLRAELAGRETAAETREFLNAVAAATLAHGLRRVLISVSSSRPLFRVDDFGIDAFLKLVAAESGGRVALLSDSDEVRAAHEYVEVLARQCGAAVRSFRSETPAVEWLKGD